MTIRKSFPLIVGILLAGGMFNSAHAALFISEVDAGGSGATTGYAADWFEVTNTGPTAVDITGWKMDDNSFAFGSAVSLRLVTSIGAGQSVVFLEGLADGSTDSTLIANFETAWFGASVPAGFTIGTYGGTSVGLSTTADGVILFDAGGTQQAKVSFAASTAAKTFDNAAGLDNTTISTISAVGVNGGFSSLNATPETGSPGTVPEPASLGILAMGGLALLARRRK